MIDNGSTRADVCTGPTCAFTGPASGAEPGPCTMTPGYISNAELNLIINNPSITSKQYVDPSSDSNGRD
jgi:hypothetical protein